MICGAIGGSIAVMVVELITTTFVTADGGVVITWAELSKFVPSIVIGVGKIDEPDDGSILLIVG